MKKSIACSLVAALVLPLSPAAAQDKPGKESAVQPATAVKKSPYAKLAEPFPDAEQLREPAVLARLAATPATPDAEPQTALVATTAGASPTIARMNTRKTSFTSPCESAATSFRCSAVIS